MKKSFLGLILLSVGFSFPIFAEEYVYKDETYKISFHTQKDVHLVTVSLCKENKCQDKEIDSKWMATQLEQEVKAYSEFLSDPAKLENEVKSQTGSLDKSKVLVDPETKKEYVMLKIGKTFNLPLEKTSLKDGSTALVENALKGAHDRYDGVVRILKEGKAPASFETENYTDIIPVMSVYYAVSAASQF